MISFGRDSGTVESRKGLRRRTRAEFQTYAYIRIKGAILDELRRACLLPSNVGKRVRQAMELSRQITEQTGSVPTDEELAGKLGIEVEEVYALFESARAQHFVSIDTVGEEEPALGDVLASSDISPPTTGWRKPNSLRN